MHEPYPRALFLPDESIVQALNERYFRYAASLPPPLDAAALDRRYLLGTGKPTPIRSLRELYPLVISLPWLFAQAFPSVVLEDLLDIAEAGALLNLKLLVFDHLLDGQVSPIERAHLLHQQLQADAFRKFQQLFEPGSMFWACFDRYYREYTAALVDEVEKHWDRVGDYSLETMSAIGAGKVALFKAIAAALALRAGHAAAIPALEEALDTFAAGLQLGDDIMDWAEDYPRRRHTLPLTMAIPSEQRPCPSLTLEEIARRFEESLILETLMKQVLAWFRRAQAAVSHLACPDWMEFVEAHHTYCEAYYQSLIAGKLLRIIEK